MTVGPFLCSTARSVSVVDLLRIVTAETQRGELGVAEVRNQVQQFGILAEKFLADVGPALDLERLPFAVQSFFHALEQQAGGVALEEIVPIRAPDHLDDIPSGAAEGGFQLLNDLAVAAHRAVEALQVAVDHPDQVVEPLARSQSERAESFGLVSFAVADEGPDLARGDGNDAAIFQVAHETRLVDGIDGAQAHGHCGETPEMRHQPGMWIRRQARLFTKFVAEIFQVLFRKPAQQKGSGVNAGRGVALEVDEVAGLVAVVGAEKMIKADFQQAGDGGVGGNMAANTGILLVLTVDHGERVPANQALDAALESAIARVRLFFIDANGVDVRRIELDRNFHPGQAGAGMKRFQDLAGAGGAFFVHHLVEGFQPFGGFVDIGLRRKCGFGIHRLLCPSCMRPEHRSRVGERPTPQRWPA